jgi:DNA-binding beta-propeller fold protein YncE
MPLPKRAILALALFAALASNARAAEPSDPSGGDTLTLVGRTELPGYTGDFDHFAADVKGNRLFLAAEDHGTLEVFNLKTGERLKTVSGFDAPHSILYLPDINRLIVTDSGKSMTKVLDATTYKITGAIKLTAGADSAGYDAPRKRYYIVTGGKDVAMKECFLADIDPATGEKFGDVTFDSNHTEAMAVEQNGNHIYINVTDKNYVAVVDKTKHAIMATWPIKEAEQNALVAFDEPDRRLFVVTRKPGKMIVLNADSGATVAAFDAPLRADEAIFDKANRRIYVLGGEGYIGVYQQDDPDHYRELAPIQSAPGAKTGILVPALNRLYVAASPGEGKTGAAVLQFAVAPKK